MPEMQEISLKKEMATHSRICVWEIASLCLMQDTACLELVHGDDPERCYGEGGGRGGSCLGTHVRIKDFKI